MNLKQSLLTLALFFIGFAVNAQSTYYHNQLDDLSLQEGSAQLKDSGALVTGRVITNYENGQLRMEGYYLAGKKEGVFRWWYASGQLGSEEYFVNDLKHGICSQWYANGQIKQEAEYQEGQPKGRTKYWDENGAKRKVKKA